jgi:hypothetical protein
MSANLLPALVTAPEQVSTNAAAAHLQSGHRSGHPSGDAGRLGGFVLRFALMLVGASMVLAAFGLWLVPTTQADPGMMLMKLGVSLFLLLAGLCLLVIGRDMGHCDMGHRDMGQHDMGQSRHR